MKRYLAAGILCLALSVAVLDAHVVVAPRESTAGAEQIYTVRIHNEAAVSSTMLELEVPAGIHVMQVASGDGFTFDVKKDGDRIVSIAWKQEIKPKQFKSYTFTAHNPESGALPWKAHQTLADGSKIDWVGGQGAKQPASVTTIVPKGGAKAAPTADHEHNH